MSNGKSACLFNLRVKGPWQAPAAEVMASEWLLVLAAGIHTRFAGM